MFIKNKHQENKKEKILSYTALIFAIIATSNDVFNTIISFF